MEMPSPKRMRTAAKAEPTPPIAKMTAESGLLDEEVRFLLLSGVYQDEQGNEWAATRDGPDVIVSSRHPLDEKFANKFIRLDGPERAKAPPGDSLEPAELNEEDDDFFAGDDEPIEVSGGKARQPKKRPGSKQKK